MGDLFPDFSRTEEGLSVLEPAASQVASVQNNQCVIVVRFGWSAVGPYRSKERRW